MLSGKRILITGANGGIGLSISETFLRNNARLVLFYHQKRTNIDKLLEQNQTWNSLVEVQQVDLLDDSKLEYVMSTMLKSGRIDGFIHCVTLP